MLKPSIPSKFVERVVTSPNGSQYRVVFLVTLVNGEAKARIFSVELIAEQISGGLSTRPEQSEVLCLPCVSTSIVANTVYISDYAPVVSPFTSLLFFTSQPTRAPSFN